MNRTDRRNLDEPVRDTEFDDGDGGDTREHRPVFNVSHLDHTTCLHMNSPALHLLLDHLDEFDLAEVEDGTARAMFHHLYNAGDRRPPRRDRRG